MAAAICGALGGVRAGREAADAARPLECRRQMAAYDSYAAWSDRSESDGE